MKYCVIGSGGREHALAWRLLNDGSAEEVYAIPGNGGIDPAFRVRLPVNDFKGIHEFCAKKKIDMVIVGPEAPLVEGIVDYLKNQGVPVFGPSMHAARLEGSKLFAKMIMNKYDIPTGEYREFTGSGGLVEFINQNRVYPIVIKLDGLAAGKGVGVCGSREEALEFVSAMVNESSRVFVEEYIDGEEASVLGICDGDTVIPLIAAQDHKRAYDGDKGPNTGGMGAYAPAPVMDERRMKRVHEEILKPTVEGMKNEGHPFKGVLYAGLIIRGDDIKVLEYNVRFGDPEIQVILPLLRGRLGDLLENTLSGGLGKAAVEFHDKFAVTVVMASGGYPGSYEKGKIITGLERLDADELVFHAGTEYKDGGYYTSGGRVLNVTALGKSFAEARERAYRTVGKIGFEGAQFRMDIGHRAMKFYGLDR